MHDDSAEQARERQAAQHRRQGKLRRKLSNLLRLAYNVTKAGRQVEMYHEPKRACHATSSTRRSPPHKSFWTSLVLYPMAHMAWFHRSQ